MIISDGNTKIGAFHFSNRKNPSICIQNGNECTAYGSFRNEECANEFMKKLAELVETKESE